LKLSGKAVARIVVRNVSRPGERFFWYVFTVWQDDNEVTFIVSSSIWKLEETKMMTVETASGGDITPGTVLHAHWAQVGKAFESSGLFEPSKYTVRKVDDLLQVNKRFSDAWSLYGDKAAAAAATGFVQQEQAPLRDPPVHV